ncbi:MAG: PAS domain S-box protein [bacterium]|nr:PAS domain S-box protein [bacterium]
MNSEKRKLLFTMAALLLLISMLVAVTVVMSNSQKALGLQINLAGRQRMLSQRLTKEVLILASVAEGVDTKNKRDSLATTILLFDTTLHALRDGGTTTGVKGKKVRLPRAPSHAIVIAADQGLEIWHDLQPGLTGLADGSVSPYNTEGQHVITDLLENNIPLLTAMDEATGAFQEVLDMKVRIIQGLTFFVWILSLLFVVGVYYMSVKSVIHGLRNYLSNIIDSMPSVLVGVDADGRVTQWNKKAEHTTGITAAVAQGKILSDVFPQMASEMGKITESIRTRATAQEQKRLSVLENDVRYENVTIYPLIANEMEGAVIRIDDVTEKVRMEEMMIQSEKMLSVGGLAAGMAHEVNNPLAVMILNARVMRDRLTNSELPANQRAAEEAGTSMEAIRTFMDVRGIIRMLGRIRESGHRAAKIVQNTLSFARKSDSTFSTHNLADLLDQIVDLAGSDYDLKKKFDFRQIEIVREYEENLPDVPCEASKIQQVFLNILRNGAEAMQEEAEQPKRKTPRFILRLAHEKDAGRVRVEIEDNGPGMDGATRKRVFEPFFTTKPVGVGTGLGLSISYFIITENHGGEMDVESTPGVGTTFMIRLPIERRTS